MSKANKYQFGALIIGDEILSGRRLDKHLAHVIETLVQRGLELAWARFVGDDKNNLIQTFREIRVSRDIWFAFGGIGATPDDKTRQAVAAAYEVSLLRHKEAVKEIEAQFGEAAYPNRILMADLPQGASLIPNPFNRIPGFSLERVHCLPGFPEMAWPMLEWVLDNYYSQIIGEHQQQLLLKVVNVYESELLELMQSIQLAHPTVKLSSLPKFLANNEREIELGIKGTKDAAGVAFSALKKALTNNNIQYYPAN
ncbi:competence/damage-inducible protein A [Kaarinaea lacus]